MTDNDSDNDRRNQQTRARGQQDRGCARPQVEEADLQENLGEFPSHLTDQGERPQTPAKRRRHQPE